MSAEIPEEWKRVPLSDLADYHNGRAFKPADWSRSGLPIIRIAQINKPDSETDYYSGDDIEDRHLVQNGDLLFSWSATLTAIKWQWGQGVVNQHIFKVVERTGVDRGFLLYTILNSIDALADHSHGTTMKHIKKGVLKTYCVGLPPLPEQRRIADILSSVDDAIAATQAVIDQTRTVKQGVLKRLLTKGIGHTRFKQTEIGEIPEEWQVKILGEVATFQPGFAFKSSDFCTTGDRLLRGSNVGVGCFNWENSITEHFPAERRDEFKEYVLGVGDIVIAMDRPFISSGFKTARIMPDDLPAMLLQRVGRFIPSEKYDSDWLWQLISAGTLGDHLLKRQVGTDLPHISKKDIESCVVAVPNIYEQKEIASYFNDADENLSISRKFLLKLSCVKSALMSDLLTGRKRVTISEEDVAAAE